MTGALDELLQAMFDSTALGVTVADRDGRWLRSNPAFLRMLGYAPGELVGKTFLELTHEDDRAENARLYGELWAGERTTFTMEKRFLHRSGSAVCTRVTVSLSSDGQLAVAMVEDITHLRSEREERVRLEYDLGERVKELTCLHGAARVLAERGLSTENLLEGIAALLPPAFQFPSHASARVRLGSLERVTEGFREAPHELSVRFTAGGESGELSVRYHAPPLTAGQPAFLTEEQSLLDSLAELLRVELERRRADEAMARSTERLELALGAAQMGLWEWDVVANRSYGSESLAAFVGLQGPLDGELGHFASYIHPDDRAALYAHLQQLAEVPWLEPREIDYRLARPEGGWRSVHARAFVSRDATGRATRVLAILIDVTVQRALREQLEKSQQHDALGLITSSVAHDFNNVLAATLSGIGLLMMDLPPGPALEAARAVEAAGKRGAALTKQMLGFSRKADFRRAEVDVATAVERNRPLLERLLGDGVKVVTSLSPMCVAICNAEQLDQVLLIFALNAHEAMGGAGTVSISVRPVELSPESVAANPDARPGPLVELAFTDTGPGLTADVAARAFEPWFTTRQTRGASGLGLSLAMNIARQHEGHLTLESRPGAGATFRLYLPRDG